MKLFIISSKRFGKDHLAERLQQKIGLKFVSSSYFCAENYIYPELKDKYNYKSVRECFDDRMNHREEWYNKICQLNSDNKCRVAEDIFKSNDCYVGIRSREELDAAKEKWDDAFVIYVDASKRLPIESEKSCTIGIDQADLVIYNNGTVEEFDARIDKLIKLLRD